MKFIQFSSVEQKLSAASGAVVKTGAKSVFFNVHVYGKKLSVFIEFTKTFSNGGLAVADRLDFRTRQYNPCGELIEKLVFKPRLFVLYVDSLLHGAKLTTYSLVFLPFLNTISLLAVLVSPNTVRKTIVL